MIKGMAAGNLLISSAVLLSGATYTKLATLAEILGLGHDCSITASST